MQTKKYLLQRKRDLEKQLKQCNTQLADFDKKREELTKIPENIREELSKEFKILDKPRKYKTTVPANIELTWEEGIIPTVEIYTCSERKLPEYKQYKKEIDIFWKKLEDIATKYNVTDIDLFYLIS